MSEFLYDKAFMALKSQRYEEAQIAYEKVLEGGYSVDAWTGLGVCKIFQLADNVQMDEVIYCFSKAKEVEGANVNEIELKLLSYALLVSESYGVFAVKSIKNALQAEKNAKNALYVALGSLAIGGLSNSIGTKVIAGVATGAAAGVSIGQFGKALSSAALAELALGLLNNINIKVNAFISHSEMLELTQLNTRIKDIREDIRYAGLTGVGKLKGDALKQLEDIEAKEGLVREKLNHHHKKSAHADVQDKKVSPKLQKEAEEKEVRIQKRRELIKQEKPEINYDKYQHMQKAKAAQMVISGIVGVILFIAFSWWLGIIAAGVAYMVFEKKNFSTEKLIEVFGEEITTKYDNNWTKLNEEYKDDMPKI